MKITFVLPCPDLSGGIRVIGIYAKQLQARGHEITFVSSGTIRPSLIQQAKSILKGKGLFPTPNRPVSHLDSLEIEHRKLAQHRPVVDTDVPDGDVVIATWWETAEWVWNLSSCKGVKVHFMQDYEVWGGATNRVDAACRLPIPKIVIADWVKNLLQERFNQAAIALIPNSVEIDKFYAPPRAKQSVPTVGLTYTAMYNKGCDISLKAYQLAKQVIPNLRLVAFGNRDIDPNLPLPDDATYYQNAPDSRLKDIYSHCDVWLFGTRIEGFGLPILEAMACRTPVIGTPAGAAPELLTDGAGILVQPEDPEDMARAIVRVCQMPEAEWQQMSELAHKRVSTYTWKDAVDQLEAVLTSLVQAGKEQPGHRISV